MAEPEEGVAEPSGAPEGGGQGEEVVASGEESGEKVQDEEEVPEDEIPTHAEIAKITRMQSIDPGDLPQSYSNNSEEEELVLEYVENFRRQFVQLYPERKELLLCPRNECGVEKFICTTVRPTKLEYNDLYDLEHCASFVAEHIQYEPLADPVVPPMYVPSPTSVLAWQIGDCIDKSVVLASLLIGVGYDAYVVIGYADKTTCLADETRQTVKMDEVNGNGSNGKSKKGGEEGDEKKEGYEVKQRPVLDSGFVMTQDKLVRLDEELVRKELLPADDQDAEEEDAVVEDALAGLRIHCWVLVRAGKRDMTEDVFVEASTGNRFATDASPYVGIEAVFNHKNYWVDMQRVPVKEMRFDLADFQMWEFVFMESTVAAPKASGDEEAKSGDALGVGGQDSAVAVQGTEEIRDSDHILDLPPSWVERLSINRADFLQRYAKEDDEVKKTKDYRKCRVELFAENSLKHGMMQRVTHFSDLARTNAVAVEEMFANRKDKLRRRVRYYKAGSQIEIGRPESLIEEYFDPGRPDALMELVERPDGREFTFYHKATLDGMVKRIELFTRNRAPTKPPALRKVTETFEGHEQRLNYRSITFEPIDPNTDAPAVKQQIEHPKKMTHKFDRDPAIEADKDLRKRTFFTGLRPPKINLVFHYGQDRITAATRTYTTEKTINGDNFTMQEYVVDPFAKPMKFTEQRDEYIKLTMEEKAAISDFRDAEREASKILETRENDEKHPQLVKSLYVQLQDKKLFEANKPKEEDSDAALKYDYLAPYLPKRSKKTALTKQEAQGVKDACLKALKERLIDRAHIIETRLEEEQAALTKRQLGYHRQDKEKSSDDDEYEKYVHEAQFKIQILKQRRDRHEEIAKQKFKEMIERLQSDPRLAILSQ